ncbi:helix-turn-helix domain-containing protein [Afifella pfennigii]|uniref:helix-turn-helix domain-containing protein n=1 Tax=Afifella pfennigii TaxID=209897 RepID=UPI00047BFA18|nr:AraC family transcriptional regulator [Afifella pfennigii]
MTTPTITARTLGSMPALIERECGERALHQVFAGAGLPLRLIEERDFYIPQAALKSFVAGASDALGSQDIGLLAAPHLSVTDYGSWGDYVLGGATLGEAMNRALETVYLHASGDWLALIPRADDLLFAYRFADAGGPGYDDVAFVAAAVMRSIPRSFLGRDWSPDWLALDIAARPQRWLIEHAFGCDVRLGKGCVAFPVSRDLLLTPRPRRATCASVTLRDVVRDRRRSPPRTTIELVRELIRLRLGEGRPDLETVAEALDLGPRTLQRALASENMSYRNLARAVMTERACELLALPGMSVTNVAAEVGYSTPANFARAFAAQTGTSPSLFKSQQSQP